MPNVDVVVVSYNSRERLRACLQPLLGLAGVRAIVVDNASPDGSLEAVSDLDVTTLQLPENNGFAHGVNAGWRSGSAPYVLLLNPDARIDGPSIEALVAAIEEVPRVGAVAPRIVHTDGSLDYSQRRFPRLQSTYAQALFLHRIFASASWTDELIRAEAAYATRSRPDWVSGACVLVRRRALEELSGLDEGFFMYCEDIDLCKRLRALGYEILFAPEAVVVHEGGASTPRAQLLPVLAASRLRYASKHRGRTYALLERAGIALGAVTHAALGRGGGPARAGHLRALCTALRQPTQS
jgi:N-acetylglucosaminyl-diphospho-decaprenol L-rhamnosyltransferase